MLNLWTLFLFFIQAHVLPRIWCCDRSLKGNSCRDNNNSAQVTEGLLANVPHWIHLLFIMDPCGRIWIKQLYDFTNKSQHKTLRSWRWHWIFTTFSKYSWLSLTPSNELRLLFAVKHKFYPENVSYVFVS